MDELTYLRNARHDWLRLIERRCLDRLTSLDDDDVIPVKPPKQLAGKPVPKGTPWFKLREPIRGPLSLWPKSVGPDEIPEHPAWTEVRLAAVQRLRERIGSASRPRSKFPKAYKVSKGAEALYAASQAPEAAGVFAELVALELTAQAFLADDNDVLTMSVIDQWLRELVPAVFEGAATYARLNRQRQRRKKTVSTLNAERRARSPSTTDRRKVEFETLMGRAIDDRKSKKEASALAVKELARSENVTRAHLRRQVETRRTWRKVTSR
jgi:hypothetical protein